MCLLKATYIERNTQKDEYKIVTICAYTHVELNAITASKVHKYYEAMNYTQTMFMTLVNLIIFMSDFFFFLICL